MTQATRNMQRNKSRSRLYDAIQGTKQLTGDAGISANWTVLFNAAAAVGDTYTVGDYYFEFVANGSEDYTTEGTSADPVLITIGTATTDATKAASGLVLGIHGFAATAAWGFLHPDDSVGCSSSTGTVTFNFWPGLQANAATYITEVSSVGTDATVTNVSDGTVMPDISLMHATTAIDTTGFDATNEQFYNLEDGDFIGQRVQIIVDTIESSDTPTILGNLTSSTTAYVMAQFQAAEEILELIWTGTSWKEIGVTDTEVTFTASA